MPRISNRPAGWNHASAARTAALALLALPVLTFSVAAGSSTPAGKPARSNPFDAPPPAPGEGVQWQQISLDDALKKAADNNQMIMIDFWARHCGACGQQEVEVWDTPDGAKLTEGLIPIRFETTTPEGMAASNRFPVTGLPDVLFLRPDGTEIDRVEGYFIRADFLNKARTLKEGLDPLPAMEVRLQMRPDSLPLVYDILEKYLNRRREADAESLYVRILRLDPQDRASYAERAMMRMARQAEFVHGDYEKTAGYYKSLVEQFPQSNSSGGAVDEVYKCYMMMGKPDQWAAWIRPILEKNPTQATLNRGAAITGLQGGLHGAWLAQAARVAAKLGYPQQKAFMDSIAVVLEGTSPQK